MPNAIDGFSGNEIVARVQNYVGNTSQSFLKYVQETLPLAQFRFCKMHDWKFLRKTGLSLTITNGQAEYELSVANIGFYMQADDVESIFHQEQGIYLKKVDLNQIRRFDPMNNDGSASNVPAMWASIGDNKIRLWPPSIETGTLRIDGKITPSSFPNLAQPSVISYRYQESFIDYVIAMALDRENDDRAPLKKQDALSSIRQDINDDMAGMANTDEPRIRSQFEKADDGVSSSISGFPFWDWE